MLNTSLLEILRTFDKAELKRFEDFVQSPYFNKKTIIIKLFKNLKKYAPDFKKDNLKREIVWKSLYPEKEFNYGVMKNLIYDLTQLVERFLAEETISNNKFELGKNLLYNLVTKDLGKILLSKYNLLEDKLNNSEEGPEKYERLIDLKWMYYSSLDNMDSNDVKNIYEIADLTIISFLINIFKIYNNISAQKFTSRSIKDNDLLEYILEITDLNAILEFIKKYSDSDKDYKILKMYYDMYKAIKNTDNSDFYYEFKNNVIKNSGMLDVDEKRNLFACLWTSLSYNKVIKNKPLEFNDLNKLSHKINILEDSDGTISMRNYSLGIRFAALAKDVDFLIEFMNYYRNLLRPSVIENMTLYSNAYLNFANKKFDTALELASKINFDLTTFKYELKNLLIMIYYELDDADSVIYSSDSYRHFAANNKYVSEESRILIIKFINYVNTLCKLRISPDNIKLGMLKESVLNDSLNTKYWLLEKIEELEKL